MCNHNVRVFPSTDSPLLWPPTPEHNTAVKFYTFCQDQEEFPATVPVSVLHRQGPLSMSMIRVRIDGKSVPVKEWLIRLADDSILKKRNASTIDYL